MVSNDHDISLLTQTEAAEYLHVEPRTLEAWRQRGTGPRFISYSKRCVRYRIGDLEDWVAQCAIQPDLREVSPRETAQSA